MLLGWGRELWDESTQRRAAIKGAGSFKSSLSPGGFLKFFDMVIPSLASVRFCR
jgi:hypothetical protein